MTDTLSNSNAPYYSDLCRYGTRFLKSQTKGEDLAQEVYLRYINSGQKFEGTRLRNWLFRVARNLIIDIWRSPKNQDETLVDISKLFSGKSDCKSTNPATTIEQQDLVQAVLTKLEKCGKRTREIFRLKFFQGMTSDEIGTELGIASSTVRKVLQDKIKKIRAEFQ